MSLNPDQFGHVAEHVQFQGWARQQQQALRAEHTVEPGHIHYPREAGRRMSRLGSAQVWLEDTYSANAHESFGKNLPRSEILKQVNQPLEEVLPDHHDLINDFRASRGKP
jgi:hypothetical protein